MTVRLLTAALGVAFFLSTAARPARADDAVAYVLDAAGVAASGRVRIEIALPAPVTAPAALVLGYPGGYSLVLYDGTVENVKGVSPDGTTLAVARDANGPRWSLGKAGQRVARVAYEVDVARMERQIRESVSASRVRPRYAGFLGYSVFAYVDGEERRPASLEVRAPESWPVLTTLAPAVPAPVGKSSARAQAVSATRLSACPRSVFEPENPVPVGLHAHDSPSALRRLVERFLEPAERGLAVVGVLALGVVVPDEEPEARTGA
jgi:hypothetical protein